MSHALVSYSAHFRELAEGELRRHQVLPVQPLTPAVSLVTFPGAYPQLASRWRERPPIYLHHASPVDRRLERGWQRGLDRLLKQALRSGLLHRLKPGLPFSVQVRHLGGLPASDLELELERLVASLTGLPSEPRRPAQVISVAISQDATFLGVSHTCQNLSPCSGGVRAFAPDPQRINRAELKLLEALEVFRLHPQGRALDLGASPGGWTRVLTLHGLQVSAVDPHERGFHPALQGHPQVTLHPISSEVYLAQTREKFDWIVNDMILWAPDSARLMVTAAPLLSPNGHALMTLKLGTHHQATGIDHALRILRRAYRIPRLRQLAYNRKEVTAWLRPLEGNAEAASQ